MKPEHLKTIWTTALATAAIALAGFWPAFLNGANDGNAVTPSIKIPKLTAGPIEITLVTPENPAFRQGDELQFDLVAVNNGDQQASVLVDARMTALKTPPRMARTPGSPVTLWQEPLTIVLGPHETRTYPEAPQAELPGNSKMNIYLRSASDGTHPETGLVSMFSFSTAADSQPSR
jgi:hypothetical protein